jgi:DNA polymerase III delta prime subunit
MDAYLEGDFQEQEFNITPNIGLQLNKFNNEENIAKKQIPEKALFAPTLFKDKLKKFYETNLDIPLLIYGVKGVGKLTTILGLINMMPMYFSDVKDINDSRRINNLYYMKILDNEYKKLFIYENLFYLNIEIFLTTNEITQYLKYIYKISKNKSIDGNKKIIIINHIENCNKEALKYINFILDKLNSNTSYIFITTKLNIITNKIKSSCARINFGHLTENEFTTIFKFNYKNIFDNKYITPVYLKNYYDIYINNQYNIGNTINQIKYLIQTQNITIDKLKNNDYKQSLLYNICKNFIKKKLKLSTINTALEIRKFLYTLLSLNIDLLDFSKMLIKLLLESNINNISKSLIIEKAGLLSKELININKEVISVECFIYNIIYIIYSNNIPYNNL